MVKKRLIGVITVLDGWAVQSIGYDKYLPLGKPSVIAKNLDNWGADEILILSIDRSKKNIGPDFNLISSITNSCISTPLIYGGGINSLKDAEDCIKSGCERISIDYLVQKNHNVIKDISMKLGCQSIIASIPLFIEQGNLFWFNHVTKSYNNNFEVLKNIANENQISEFLLIDKNNEGKKNSFDKKLIEAFPLFNKPLILFGGISEIDQIKRFLIKDNISSIGIGNFLNYKEHCIQSIKKELGLSEIRKPFFSKKI